jgi:uncharacterized protein
VQKSILEYEVQCNPSSTVQFWPRHAAYLGSVRGGDHYFDTIAPDAVFEFRCRFPGYPTKIVGREALMALYAGYGKSMALHGADALVVNISQTPGVVDKVCQALSNDIKERIERGKRSIGRVTHRSTPVFGTRALTARAVSFCQPQSAPASSTKTASSRLSRLKILAARNNRGANRVWSARNC